MTRRGGSWLRRAERAFVEFVRVARDATWRALGAPVHRAFVELTIRRVGSRAPLVERVGLRV